MYRQTDISGKLTETIPMKKTWIIILFISTLVSCESTGQKGINKQCEIKEESSNYKSRDSFLIKETFNQVDNPTNEYLSEKLKPIRENFKRINSISLDNWSSIVSQDLEGTNEGGEVTYYHWNNKLDKIVTKEFGETFQVLTEYYLLNGKLSFVYQKGLHYNRSIWKQKPELEDNEVFDKRKSAIEETRCYFENEKLINLISNQESRSPFSEEYLLEQQKEFIYNFDRVLKQENKKANKIKLMFKRIKKEFAEIKDFKMHMEQTLSVTKDLLYYYSELELLSKRINSQFKVEGDQMKFCIVTFKNENYFVIPLYTILSLLLCFGAIKNSYDLFYWVIPIPFFCITIYLLFFKPFKKRLKVDVLSKIITLTTKNLFGWKLKSRELTIDEFTHFSYETKQTSGAIRGTFNRIYFHTFTEKFNIVDLVCGPLYYINQDIFITCMTNLIKNSP